MCRNQNRVAGLKRITAWVNTKCAVLKSAGSATICRDNLTSCKNAFSYAISRCHDHTSERIEWALRQYGQQVERCGKTDMLRREGIQLSSLVPAVTTAHCTSAWMKEQRCRERTCCAVWTEMSFRGYNTETYSFWYSTVFRIKALWRIPNTGVV